MTPRTGWLYFEHPHIQVTQLTWACVRGRTRLLQKLKLGFMNAYQLANNKKGDSDKVIRAIMKRERDSSWPVASDLSIRSVLFDDPSYWIITLGASMITVGTCSRTWTFMKQGQYHWYRSLRLTYSFRILDDPSYWMIILWKSAHPGRTVDAGVRMTAHAFAAKVTVGIY